MKGKRLEPHVKCLEKEVENELHEFDKFCHFRDTLVMVSKKESVNKESLLRPLSRTAEVLGELGPRAQRSVREELPQQCQYIVDKENLDKIIDGIPPEVKTEEWLRSNYDMKNFRVF
ncbi:unnamed protein product [Cylicocyclus nassatus]|uniref:Uncharacterized protein n=1 Tax=Cylicocyclus nassatus TaxID=53992 RepID=A0AA36H3Y4_CYLNA|nr:unnamed protein product [Cylicocyclus nassatus]